MNHRLMVGFKGTSVPPELAAFFELGPPAGVVVFGRNIESTSQLAALIRELRALWPADGPAPLIAVDQEGGPVRRLKAPACAEFAYVPAMREAAERLGADGLVELGRLMACQLAAVGFNVDFAPVLDVDTNPDNPIIGRRAFAASPAEVARLALAFAEGLKQGGVVACGKHFPGHGDTHVDSHLELPRISAARRRLEAVELAPFRAAVEADIPMLMTAHIVFEAFDPDLPATLSPTIIPGLLRQTMGFDGVVVSDDLEMKAIADHFSIEDMAALGVGATVDLFLVCSDLDFAAELSRALTVVETPERDAVARRRLDTARFQAVDHALTASSRIPFQQFVAELFA